MRPWLLLILLAGCFGPTAPEPPAWDDAYFGEGQAVGGTDAAGDRDAGEIILQRQGNHWVASQRISLSGTTGAAARIDVDIDSFNGEITSARGNGYSFVVDTYGRGETQDDAREALAKMTIDFGHAWDDDVLMLSAEAKRDGKLAAGQGNGAAIDARVPLGPAYIINARTSNGGITVVDHMGPGALLRTSNGGVEYTGDTDLLWISTSNGGVEVLGGAIDIEVDASNGPIEATLRPWRSGHHDFDTSNGPIELEYHGDAALDVRADTSNGDATVVFPGGEPVGRQDDDDAHVRSAGYASAEVQVSVVADTSNGNVLVTNPT